MNKTISLLFASAVILAPMLPFAQERLGTIVKLPGFSFKYSLETTASQSRIWSLWSDVENWNKFDTLLEYSYLVEGASFETGAIGYLKASGAPRTKFELIEVDQQSAFVERLKLPLYQAIDLQRYFEPGVNGVTTFTHEVNFKGVLSPLLYALLGGTFKRELRAVMDRLKTVAESEVLPIPN